MSYIRKITCGKLILLNVLFLILPIKAAGKEDVFHHNLDSYLVYAIENNPLIEASRVRIKTQQEVIKLSKKIPDPKITAAYFINEVETRVGPQRAKVGLSQMLPWPGKLISKSRIQGSLYEVSEEKVSEVTSRVLASVRSLYAKLYLTGQSIRISEENLKLLKQLEPVLMVKYSTGTIKQAALIKIQVEMSLIEDKINSLNSKGIIEKEKLRSLLNISNEVDIPFPDKLPHLKVEKQMNSLSISRSNPELQQKSFQKNARAEKVSLAKKGFAPDLMLMTDYVFTDEVDPAMGNPKDNGKDPWVIGASINLPLTIGKKRAEIEKANLELDEINSSIRNLENRVESDLISAKEKYSYSEERRKLYEDDLVPKAKHVMVLTEENYKNGTASILDYIDAQRMVLNLDIAVINEMVKRELASAEIDRLLGGYFTKLELDR